MNTAHQNLLDEVPSSDHITAYDEAHFTTYMRLLDAAADDASDEEMTQLILGIDPEAQPQRAQKNADKSFGAGQMDRGNRL